MSKFQKLLFNILSGKADRNFNFMDLIYVLEYLDFEIRIKGSHHIFSKEGITEIINLQPDKNNKSKAYQVKQVRNMIIKYKLGEIKYE
ncbi:MAG: toxin HicA [Ignavibacteria bacterium GWB2_35_12]|nr:MAG: toxin HicA [Ignavibacteria bacterium GWA2_35_8]OGU39486.1 MAG: toxin HicA [Ignavibacteria bacterium GWB2_35_12]OGU90168.1 MAG: toxin HicA [Ignavibacteria bacterium RIFOXYA2_FULL_35_10]OGV21902.1 MAG: toxin HicA [Ignavibacteria bacterium RIFOXYC2_FULL_35_21]